MPIKRANVLDEEALAKIRTYIDARSHYRERDWLMVMLTCHVGLRAQEVALTHADDVLDAHGRLKETFFVSARGAKYGKSRSIRMTPELGDTLRAYLKKYNIDRGPLFHNRDQEPMRANAVSHQLRRIYLGAGLRGCSSHSGRRSFGTRTAKMAFKFGGSLVDVQQLLGHSDIKTTTAYVDYTPRQAELVTSIWGEK